MLTKVTRLFRDVLSDSYISEPLSPREEDDAGLLDGSEDKDAIPLSVMAWVTPATETTIHQTSNKALALAVRTLNVSSLLSAYQVEFLVDMGGQLEKGPPSPTLWKEIITVNDLVLHNAHQAVQSSGHYMALSWSENMNSGLIYLVSLIVKSISLVLLSP